LLINACVLCYSIFNNIVEVIKSTLKRK